MGGHHALCGGGVVAESPFDAMIRADMDEEERLNPKVLPNLASTSSLNPHPLVVYGRMHW